ncbi:MAG: hypothetical protein CBC38_03950 [Gammaproteobacteria bacterium TMED78]|nr:MAG: hypothetical protein CBC38_03950 [Gammaproteobacteria bacterium TMED78]|tara:strand:+ start:131 stop:679 length:549 start_codon:yes stop_codon:yes gene_type:complete
MKDTKINFKSIKDALNLYEISVSPSELHGFLCGIMTSGARLSSDKSLIASFLGSKKIGKKDPEEMFIFLEKKLLAIFYSDEMSFEPIISPEEVSFMIRTDDLSLWCSSYLYGLGIGGIELNSAENILNSNTEEIVNDLVEISKACIGENEKLDNREVGFSFQEVFEYVRVSVQVLFESFNKN